ncbi:thermonuclease family protein [Roseibium sediminis]|uniref:thermonuclease family protein n=1 Tax=Roseibium sediminis TaxID=1775174 RepID=UPI00137546CE|nr:thermonuclease family protein [Roseibium sediminis]
MLTLAALALVPLVASIGQSSAQTTSQATGHGPAPDPSRIRNVSPEGVTPPPVTGPLKRIEPSRRYQELVNPPVEPVPDGPLVLRRVHVLSAADLATDELKVRLAHVQPLVGDATCEISGSTSWPCGARARTFLRGLVRQFQITCTKEADAGPKAIIANCQRGTMDLSEALIRNGWADVSEAAPPALVALRDEAKAEKLGIWRQEWSSPYSAVTTDPEPGTEVTSPAASLTVEESGLIDLGIPGLDPASSDPVNPFDFPSGVATDTEDTLLSNSSENPRP